MSCTIRIVPWYDKAEWQQVYDGAFSNDVKLQEAAYMAMLKWQRKKNYCPHGVECTSTLLQVMMRDPEISRESIQPLGLEDLKLMYSTAIMRVVNVVTETIPKSSKITMIQMAEKYAIPTWIIDLRHEVAHGTTVPDIGILRMAAKHLKDWLKGYYWEVEKKSSRDFIIERPREVVIEERLTELLKIYINLKKYSLQKQYERVRDIPDIEVKTKISRMTKLRTNLILAEYKPWEYKIDESQDIQSQKMMKSKISKATKMVSELCKDYLKTDFCDHDTCQVLVDTMVKETGDDFEKFIWAQMIFVLHSCGRLMPFMMRLAKTCCSFTEYSHFCGLWLLELSKAILKRVKVEELKSQLSSLKIGKAYAHAEFSDPKEKKLLKKLVLKKRLNVEADGRTVLEALMKRVENKYSFLKTTLRLSEPVNLNPQEVEELIKAVAMEPNAYSVKCVPVLIELVDPPMPRRDKKNLLRLINIYMGNVNMSSGYFFEIHDVSSFLKDNEIETVEDQTIENKQPSLSEESSPGSYEVTVLDNYDWSSIPFGVVPWEVKEG